MVKELRPDDPAVIGPYRLLGRLGTGGMGNVFLGQSPGGRLVAVKVIRPELADEPGFRVRFAREVAAARHVSGLFTALVVDADPDAAVPWLATAYVAGPSLSEAVTEHGPLPVSSVLALAAGLAEGLGVIHQAGVVHRDLKPANVLLAHDGPRVIDFGISRAMETTMLTQTGTVVGSPGFMSPEQADGKVVGPPSDVFSLGAVLAFAATGEGPFGSGPTPALMYRVVNHEPDLASLPPRVRAVVARCLAKEPAARPATAELLAELDGGQLAVNWLPEPVAAALGRYAPPATAASWPATVDRPPAGSRVRTPTEPAAGFASGGVTAPDRAGHGNWRRPGWLAAAAAVAVAAALTGFALSGPGPEHPVAEPSAHPVAAVKTTASARETGAARKPKVTVSHRAKSAAKRHPARITRTRPAPSSAVGGGAPDGARGGTRTTWGGGSVSRVPAGSAAGPQRRPAAHPQRAQHTTAVDRHRAGCRRHHAVGGELRPQGPRLRQHPVPVQLLRLCGYRRRGAAGPGSGGHDLADRAGPAVRAGEQLRDGARRDRHEPVERRVHPQAGGLHEHPLPVRLLRLVPNRRRGE